MRDEKEKNPDSLFFDIKENLLKPTVANYSILGAFFRMAFFIFRPKFRQQRKSDLIRTRKNWKIYYVLYHIISILFTLLLLSFLSSLVILAL